MNETEFKDKAHLFLTEHIPRLVFKKDEYDFALQVMEEGKRNMLMLKNLYLLYQSSSFEEVMNKTVSLLHYPESKKEVAINFNRDKIIPIVRDFSHSASDILTRHLTGNLSIGYALEFDDYIKYIDKDMLNDFFNEENLYHSATLNTLKKGWLNPEKEEHSAAGKMILFKNEEDEFLFQFFIQDMYEHYLGDEFYLILPTKHVAMVLIPNHINEEAVLEGMLKLKEFAVKLYAKESHNISEKLYHIKEGSFRKLG